MSSCEFLVSGRVYDPQTCPGVRHTTACVNVLINTHPLQCGSTLMSIYSSILELDNGRNAAGRGMWQPQW